MKKSKFILTENLNKLASWLRILGYDTIVARSISFDKIITLAVNERRIVLTRSSKQANSKKKFTRVLIKEELPLKQMEEITHLLEYDEENLFTRCLNCNSPLHSISKENLPQSVPEFVQESLDDFRICGKCNQVFWQGTHYKDMLAKIRSFFNI